MHSYLKYRSTFSSRILLFLSLALVSGSCQYQLDDIPVNPIELPDDIAPEVSILELEASPFYLTTTTRFVPDIRFESGTEFRGMEVSVDGTLIQEMSNQMVFELKPSNYDEGSHTIELVILNTTNSGSLASRLDAEVISSTYTWEFIIDKVAPAAVNVTARVLDGQLLLEWELPEKLNFTHYAIYRSGDLKVKVSDQSQTSIIDDSFIGGGTSYQIRLVSDFFDVESDPYNVNYDMVESFEVELDGETVNASWSRPTFYNNIDGLELEWNNNPQGYDVIGLNNYSFSDHPYDFAFGRVHTLLLKLIITENKTFFVRPREYSLYRKVAKGEMFWEFNELRYNANNSSLYALSNVNLDNNNTQGHMYIHRFAADTHELLGTFDPENSQVVLYGSFVISDNGEHLYMSYDGKILSIDPLTLELKNSFNINDLLPGATATTNLRVSNNNILTIGATNIDMNTQEVIWDEQAGVVSPKGNYVLKYYADEPDYSELYEVSGSTLVLKTQLERSTTNEELFLEDKGILILGYSNKVVIYDLENDVVLYEVPIDRLPSNIGLSEFSYDETNEQLLVQTVTYAYIIDINTGEVIATKDLVGFGFDLVRYKLHESKAYASSGFRIAFNEW